MSMLIISSPHSFFTLPRSRGAFRQLFASSAAASSSRISSSKITTKISDQSTSKQPRNYEQPHNWDFNHVLSLQNEHAEERYTIRSGELKEQVLMILEDQEIEKLNQLELIHYLHRLGLSYHFEEKIRSILEGIYSQKSMPNQQGLYATALEFLLLRQHGFHVSQDIFYCFKDVKGDFKSSLCEDLKGMLYLYEASHLISENESNLEMAREFTTKNLKKNIEDKRVDQELVALIQHALELPLHWRMMRLEARWFIDIYEKRPDMNPIVLELAKLDFNIVQAAHQNDLKYSLRWWKKTCLAEKLTFARDIMVENFFWTIGMISDLQYGYGRRMLTKVATLITVIDDVYDGYGTLGELELFTSAVERWDINSINQLPDYMKICYLALYNFVNQMAYDALKEQGVNIIPYLRKAWADLCKAYLLEAKWYFSRHVPTLQEYLDNALISVSAPVVLIHAYFCVDCPINKHHLEYLDEIHKIIRCSAIILRLANDLGSSPVSEVLKNGDVPKAIECYMKETGVSEEKARQHLRFLISEAWKQMNEAQINSSFSPTFNEIIVNLARMGHCMYQYGDGHGHQNFEPMERILALLFEPICSHVLT
ncbi:hypothetical protein ACH5RR_025734 [Cinchona calisaya]|uniref:myrcene synthase n=1 Tax=Cinchona calisaya TaxID=153742 RepID=A0ABD2Z4H7_9GENT